MNWSMVTCQMAAPVTGTTLRGLLALCRRALGSERHRYAFARPDKLGTDPMANGGWDK